jgi:hypothetical protein
VTAAEQMNTVDAAVDLIGLGCVVVQIAPGEKRTIGRTKALLRTREAVTAAYRATPHAEVGVDLQASRLVDIDLDDRDGRHLLDPLLRDVATPTFTSRRVRTSCSTAIPPSPPIAISKQWMVSGLRFALMESL